MLILIWCHISGFIPCDYHRVCIFYFIVFYNCFYCISLQLLNKAYGASSPDGFTLRLFKTLAGSSAEPLSLLFASFMSIGKIPQYWKHAVVTPVYRNGSAVIVFNYRPSSLTGMASRLVLNPHLSISINRAYSSISIDEYLI